jgi:hypothetical protein
MVDFANEVLEGVGRERKEDGDVSERRKVVGEGMVEGD